MLAIGVAFLASMQPPEFFFIAMLLTIGGRHFTFATLYGLRIYWICGAALAAAGIALAMIGLDTKLIALTGGTIELLFAAVIFANCAEPPPGAMGGAAGPRFS